VTSGSVLASSGKIQLILTKLSDHPSPAAQRIIMIARKLDSEQHVVVLSRGDIFIVRSKSSGQTHGRRLQATPTLTKLITVATLSVSAPIINNMIAGESYSVLSNAAVSRVNDVNQVEDKVFSAYFTQVSCAALTSTVLIDPTRLLIGGRKNSKWQMIAVGMPSLATGSLCNAFASACY